jgi:hypothetical protein
MTTRVTPETVPVMVGMMTAAARGQAQPVAGQLRPLATGGTNSVSAENLVHGSDQQSCPLCRPALMIAGHVPALRLSPDYAGGLLAADVPA